MNNAVANIDMPQNEPVLAYVKGSPEKKAIKAKLEELAATQIEIPLIIGGKEVRTGRMGQCVMPHDHGHVLGVYHKARTEDVRLAIQAARKAKHEWEHMAWTDRLSIFLRAAELLAGPHRMLLNAATMLGQSKNVFQAEIDAACELIDFLRFNAHYARRIYEEQPFSPVGFWNRSEYRPLEGFVFAVTPFNFTSIAGNLPTAPAMLGNTVLWKPASSSVYSSYHFMKILEAAGLPPGVINFIPGQGAEVGTPVLRSRDLAGVHFTGSTAVFQGMWKTMGRHIARYRSYPRFVGETGGKDFVFAHASADVAALATALARGAFEYQGQKCSAASRAYIPDNLWPSVKERLVRDIKTMKMGGPEDFTTFINAVIDRTAFENISGVIMSVKKAADAKIIAGGKGDRSTGYFIEPTVVVADRPDFTTMQEEIFGPVLTVYVYPEREFEKTLRICDRTTPYALTGAIFARDQQAIALAADILTHAAGNFYINDKPTGAVVGQQPFGGSRASGTNDKAGSILNMLRWTSPRSIKESFSPATDYRYPFMGEA